MPSLHIAAFVPMRHSSERVKGKNYRPLGGRPLFHHIVETLLAVDEIDEVVIDTDSEVIATDVAVAFPTVRVLERPEHLRAGEVPMNDVLLNSIAQVPADLYLQTHSTNPLLTVETVRDGIRELLDAGDAHDSLFTVTALHTRLWTPEGEAINHDPAVLLRTQDLPPIMEENSCMYLFDGETLKRRGNRIGERPILKPIAGAEAWDIDDELDWTVVEALYAAREVAR
ncbi:acylneuraminate cytidylyltransferase family protein [Baekduia sp. Peel2402]|uniref:acylneuraminate cytidylyltransferase family protein n=1 Tax=Baekduia sp. Peel2402 TaxID=3458296 RepID=UPI00403EF6D4